MKIPEYTVIILSLFLYIKGEKITHISVQEGDMFAFHPKEAFHKSNNSSIELKQTDRNKLLAFFSYGTQPTIIDPRVSVLTNGSIIITPIKPEDAGNYTYKIVFLDGTVQTINICLTLSTEKTEEEHSSQSAHQSSNTIWIVIWASSATAATVLLSVVIIIVFKCRKKSSRDEPIYINTLQRSKEDASTQNIC